MFSFPVWPASFNALRTECLLALAMFWTAVCLPTAGAPVQAQAAGSGPSKVWKLLFVRAGDIWIANGNGTGQHLLIKNADVPCWSPDKKLIAFERDSNIWVAHANGTHQKALTRQWKPLKSDAGDVAGVENIGIAWDEDLAIFYSHGEAPNNNPTRSAYSADSTDLLTIPLDHLPNTLALNLAGGVGGFGFSDIGYPATSLDGMYCAFACNGDIWIAARDPDDQGVPGWNISRLKAVACYDSGTNRGDAWVVATTHLSWSPDGRRLAYSLDRVSGTGQWDLHMLILKHNRFNQTTITVDRVINEDGTYPCFSPDGKWIAYWGPTPNDVFDPRSIWVMKANGANARLLIKNGSSPAW